MSEVLLLIIMLYTISAFFFTKGLISKNYHYDIWATRFLYTGAILHLLLFIAKMIKGNYFPLVTMHEVIYFYSLILMILTITIFQLFRWKIIVITIILLSIITLIGTLVIGEEIPNINEHLFSKLLIIHIILSIISYTAFTLSAIFSILYLTLNELLKRKVWNSFTKSLPNLERLEKNIYYSNVIGIIILFSGLMIGLFWASLNYNWGVYVDPKVIFSFIIIASYSISIYQRERMLWNSKQLAIWNLISFILILCNLYIGNLFYSFHRFS